MKKILSFIIAFAMIISMSSVAMAAGVACTDTCGDTTHVAAIGNTHYTSIKEAIGAAQSGDTVLVLRDSTISDIENAVVPDGVTIDGNNKTVTVTVAAGSYTYGHHINNVNDNVTIKNLNVVNTENSNRLSTLLAFSSGIIENCTFDGGVNGIHVIGRDGAVLEIKGCTFKNQTGYQIMTDDSDKTALKISGCTFEATSNGISVILRNEDSEFVDNETHNKVNVTVSNVKVEENTFYSRLKFYTDSGNSASNNVFETGATVELDKATNTVTLNGNTWKNAAYKEQLKETAGVEIIDPAPVPKPASTGNGISVKYNGGNSFSTSKSDVPTGVEIDGVPVAFSGNGSSFTVSGIPADAKWVTVRWNSTSVTTNFTPSGAYVAEVNIPKTGDMPIWAAVAAFFGF